MRVYKLNGVKHLRFFHIKMKKFLITRNTIGYSINIKNIRKEGEKYIFNNIFIG